MSNPILKPKKAMILVPGHGVIEKAEFNEQHLKALFKQQEATGVDRDAFIKQHFEIVGFGDMPLFENESEKEVEPDVAEKPKKTRNRGKKEVEPVSE